MIKEMINSGLGKFGYKVVRLDPYALSSRDGFFDPRVFKYDEAVQYIVGLHVAPEDQIRKASIPEGSLEYLSNFFKDCFTGNKPLVALHVGNFVGISLVWLASCLKRFHKDSLVVSIDPNISHLGVRYPLDVVTRIANYYSLQKNILFLVGYSLESNLRNDVGTLQSDSHRNLKPDISFENVLKNLTLLSHGNYDLALMDGNHDASYLRREIDCLYDLLGERGLLVLDDVSDYWQQRAGLKDVYEEINKTRFVKEGTDGRVGVLRKKVNK